MALMERRGMHAKSEWWGVGGVVGGSGVGASTGYREIERERERGGEPTYLIWVRFDADSELLCVIHIEFDPDHMLGCPPSCRPFEPDLFPRVHRHPRPRHGALCDTLPFIKL